MFVARTVECFYPGRSFPAISVTGTTCALDCKHCAGKYLAGMIPATTPEELLEVAEALAERDAKGFLLSGGADSSGRVRVAEFADAIVEIKATTRLKVNVHTGLASDYELRRLVRSGVDSFSVDVYGSDETIHEVLGLAARREDYLRVVRSLTAAGAKRVAPHICVGLHAGRLRGEMRAIDSLRRIEPELLVIISFVPTKGTEYASLPPPSKEALLSVIAHAREALPGTKLLLGCMRSKLDRACEFELVEAGVEGIVLPSSNTVARMVASGYTLRKREECCSLV